MSIVPRSKSRPRGSLTRPPKTRWSLLMRLPIPAAPGKARPPPIPSSGVPIVPTDAARGGAGRGAHGAERLVGEAVELLLAGVARRDGGLAGGVVDPPADIAE